MSRHLTDEATMWYLIPRPRTAAGPIIVDVADFLPLTGPHHEARRLTMSCRTLNAIIAGHPPRRSGLPVTRAFIEDWYGVRIEIDPTYPPGLVNRTG